jgi:nucleotide-binding universal stress UspA family protein
VAGGPAAATLAWVAKGRDVDLVVVGHRGRGVLARLLMGSVADRLVQICSKPVLVVH